MRTIEVTVTQEDIDNGVLHSCRRCPIALAIARAMPDEEGIAVHKLGVRLYQQHKSVRPLRLPDSAKVFIDRFDRNMAVSPFTFTLELEE